MRTTLLTLSLILLAACSPPEQAIQEAIDATATATATSVPHTETVVPTETLDALEQTRVANQTQNANYELTTVAFGTNIALTPSQTPSITPTATPHENPGLIGSPGWAGSSRNAVPVFSPDGDMLAVFSNVISVWNLDTWELKIWLDHPYLNLPCTPDNVSFNHDSSLLAASITCISDNYLGEHLLIWDTEKGTLLQDWVLDFANTEKLSEYSTFWPTGGFAFFPNTSMMAVANANTIEFRDARKSTPLDTLLDLGDEMVATNISVSDDGKLLFAFMSFANDRGRIFTTKNTLQVWDMATLELEEELTWPESGYTLGTGIIFDNETRNMSGRFLLHKDNLNEIFTVTNLVTQEERLLPLGVGRTYISPDSKYLVFIPHDHETDCNNRDIQLIETESGRAIYTFRTHGVLASDWCSGPQIVFNQENTLLAIWHNEQLSLWDIGAVVNSQQ